jgi:hypothetical protein
MRVDGAYAMMGFIGKLQHVTLVILFVVNVLETKLMSV